HKFEGSAIIGQAESRTFRKRAQHPAVFCPGDAIQNEALFRRTLNRGHVNHCIAFAPQVGRGFRLLSQTATKKTLAIPGIFIFPPTFRPRRTKAQRPRVEKESRRKASASL